MNPMAFTIVASLVVKDVLSTVGLVQVAANAEAMITPNTARNRELDMMSMCVIKSRIQND